MKHALFSYEPIFQEIYALQVSLIGELVDVVARKDSEFSGVILHLQVGCCTEETKNVSIMFRIFNAASKQSFERRSRASKRSEVAIQVLNRRLCILSHLDLSFK